MKRKGRVGVVAFVVTGLIVFIGGCNNPQVLENRGRVPAPAMEAPRGAPGIRSQEMVPYPAPADDVTITPEPTTKSAPPPATEIIDVKTPEVPVTTATPPIEPIGAEKGTVHTVKKGDSFWKLAREYKVSERDLIAANPQVGKSLKVGAKLQIPAAGARKATAAPALTSAKATGKASAKSLTIAGPKNMPPPPPVILYEGKTAKTAKGAKPAAATAGAAAEAAAGTYAVKSGDNFSLIAKRHHVSVSSLLAANNLSKTSRLKIGQKLVIPGAKPAAATAAAGAETKTAATTTAAAGKKTGKEKGRAATAAAPAATAEPAAAAGGKGKRSDELDEFLQENASDTGKLEDVNVKVDEAAAAPAAAAAEPAAAASEDAGKFLPHPVNEKGITFQKLSEMYGVKEDVLRKANPTLPADKEFEIGTKVKIPVD